MEHLKEGQLMIIRVSDQANYGRYKSYAFRHNGDIVAAVENHITKPRELIELPDVQGEFQIVKGGNLHPMRFNPAVHLFFSEQPEEIQEKYRNRNKVD